MQVSPEVVTHYSELGFDYAKELSTVSSGDELVAFIDKWRYWIDPDAQNFKNDEWDYVEKWRSIYQDKDAIIPDGDIDNRVLALLLPSRLVHVQLYASQFMVPWGTAYLRLKDEGLIDY
jgi:hypothetical protein